jgi:hypothetical protein
MPDARVHTCVSLLILRSDARLRTRYRPLVTPPALALRLPYEKTP